MPVFHTRVGGLSDSKSSQVFLILLSILADLNKAAVWMVSILNSSSDFQLIQPPSPSLWVPFQVRRLQLESLFFVGFFFTLFLDTL